MIPILRIVTYCQGLRRALSAITPKTDRIGPGKATTQVSSEGSSREAGKRLRKLEPDASQFGQRGVPFTDPILVNEVNDTLREVMDSEMYPPSSQSNGDVDAEMHPPQSNKDSEIRRPSSPSKAPHSPRKHQAQADTGPPSVPSKTRDNIGFESYTKPGHRERQENERLRRDKNAKSESQAQEYKLWVDRAAEARGKKVERREQLSNEHPVQERPRHDQEAIIRENEVEQGGLMTEEYHAPKEHPIHDGEAEEEHERLRLEQRDKERQVLEANREAKHKALIEKKRRELKSLKAQVVEATSQFDDLNQTNRLLKDEVNRLNAEWHHDLQLLESQRQVLNASRSFAAREGTLDAATLIQSFNDLNSSIGDFSFEVLRTLDDTADTRPLEQTDYKGVCDALVDPNLKFFVEHLFLRDLKASDVVDPIVTGIIVADLMSTIFKPFAPGLHKDRSKILHRMYGKMRDNEPQERSARWRSITYNHAVPNPEPQFLQQAANQSVLMVMGVLTALSGGREIRSTEELYELAHRIFEAAVKVQDRAKKEYFSFDYEVYSVSAEEKYDKLEMDISQAGNEHPSQVWMTIGLGMKARRSIQGEGGSLMSECSIPVKPMVICDNWDHNA